MFREICLECFETTNSSQNLKPLNPNAGWKGAKWTKKSKLFPTSCGVMERACALASHFQTLHEEHEPLLFVTVQYFKSCTYFNNKNATFFRSSICWTGNAYIAYKGNLLIRNNKIKNFLHLSDIITNTSDFELLK